MAAQDGGEVRLVGVVRDGGDGDARVGRGVAAAGEGGDDEGVGGVGEELADDGGGDVAACLL